MKWLAITVVLLSGCNAGSNVSQRLELSGIANPTPAVNARMQLITQETDMGGDFIFHYFIFRDKATKQELMCIRNDSCWPTGRMIDESGKEIVDPISDITIGDWGSKK